MRRASLVLLLLIGVGVTAAPGDAEACGGGNDNLLVTFVATVYIGTPTALGFGIATLVKDDPGVGYGVAEALITGPQALLYASAALEDNLADEGRLFFGAYALVHGALAIHGVHTALKSRTPHPGAPPPAYPYQPPGSGPTVRARLVPAPVTDGHRVGAGLGLVGIF